MREENKKEVDNSSTVCSEANAGALSEPLQEAREGW